GIIEDPAVAIHDERRARDEAGVVRRESAVMASIASPKLFLTMRVSRSLLFGAAQSNKENGHGECHRNREGRNACVQRQELGQGEGGLSRGGWLRGKGTGPQDQGSRADHRGGGGMGTRAAGLEGQVGERIRGGRPGLFRGCGEGPPQGSA